MAAKTSGLRNSHAASSDFVTVTKSDPKKTRVTPAQQEQAQRNQIETLKREREREREKEGKKKVETVDCEERFGEGRVHCRTRVWEVGASNFHDGLAGIKHERRGIWRGLRLDEHAPALPMPAGESKR